MAVRFRPNLFSNATSVDASSRIGRPSIVAVPGSATIEGHVSVADCASIRDGVEIADSPTTGSGTRINHDVSVNDCVVGASGSYLRFACSGHSESVADYYVPPHAIVAQNPTRVLGYGGARPEFRTMAG